MRRAAPPASGSEICSCLPLAARGRPVRDVYDNLFQPFVVAEPVSVDVVTLGQMTEDSPG